MNCRYLINKYGEAPIELNLGKGDLVAFYEKHDASKVDEVDSFLDSYTAEQIVSTLIDKYGSAYSATPAPPHSL